MLCITLTCLHFYTVTSKDNATWLLSRSQSYKCTAVAAALAAVLPVVVLLASVTNLVGMICAYV